MRTKQMRHATELVTVKTRKLQTRELQMINACIYTCTKEHGLIYESKKGCIILLNIIARSRATVGWNIIIVQTIFLDLCSRLASTNASLQVCYDTFN